MTPVMFSHVISLSFAGDDVWVAIDMFRSSSLELIASQPGFAGVVVMGNGDTGRAHAFTLWHTEAAVAAAATNDSFARDLARYASLITGPFSRDMYAVLAHAPLSPTDDPFSPAVARVTTVPVRAGGWGSAYPALRELVNWDGAEGGGTYGLTLLENRSLGRAIVVEVWDSQDALDDADRRAARFDFNARGGRWMNGRPMREQFQVAVRL